MNGMISCKSCSTTNSLDSAFCKKCGATVPADEVQQAKDKLEAAVADGFKIFSAGRTDEAIQIADTAVLANPSSTAALSLKAMCHERLGQISEALECHQKVLDIDPDSMIDKIKVNDLRNLVIARSAAPQAPNRRMALAAAAATLILFTSVGVVIAKTVNRGGERVAENTPTTTLQPKGSRPDPLVTAPGTQASTQTQNQTVQPGGTTQTPPETHRSNPENGQTPNRSSGGDNVQLPPAGDSDGRIPNVNNWPVILDPTNIPKGASVNDPGPAKTKATDTTKNDSGGDPDPRPEPPTQTLDPKKAPGIMDIQIVSGNGKTNSDPADPASKANGAEALLRTARSQFQLGNFQSASNSYERALRAGADPATINQRLAQCYERLGRNPDAVAAYNRAIDSIQADLQAGRGDKDRLTRALDACKQAVKVVGG